MIPKNKVLSVSKGGINAKLAYNMHKTTQNVTVNIQDRKSDEVEVKYPPLPPNPYAELPSTVEEYQQILTEKDNSIQALNLIIRIIQSNPLFISNFVIASSDDLHNLIQLLTSSELVEIIAKDIDVEFTCCAKGQTTIAID
jgi:hypothetical protein